MFSICIVACLIFSSALAQEAVITSNSEASLDALKANLFGNLSVDSIVDSALTKYASLSENSGSTLNEIITGLKQLINDLPATQQTILRENLDKQRENMQSYLEETDAIVSKSNSSSGKQCFTVVNTGLASYMTQSDATNNYSGGEICQCMISLGNEFPSVQTITYNRFSFNTSSSAASTQCQTQTLGLISASTGGSTSANTVVQSAASKVAALKNTLNNAYGTVQNGLQTAGNYVSNAAQSASDSLSNLASNVQNTVSG